MLKTGAGDQNSDPGAHLEARTRVGAPETGDKFHVQTVEARTLSLKPISELQVWNLKLEAGTTSCEFTASHSGLFLRPAGRALGWGT